MLDTSRSLLIEQSGCHVASHSVYTKLFIIKIYTVLSIGNGLQERLAMVYRSDTWKYMIEVRHLFRVAAKAFP